MKMTKLDALHNVRKISFVAVFVAQERQISETVQGKSWKNLNGIKLGRRKRIVVIVDTKSCPLPGSWNIILKSLKLGR